MNRTFKIISYATISLTVSYWDVEIGKSFIYEMIPVLLQTLATIFTIYLATSSLVGAEIHKIKKQSNNFPDTEVITEIKRTFLVMALTLFFLFIFYPFIGILEINFPDYFSYILIPYCAYSCCVFTYYIECVYDIGSSLFTLMGGNE